MWPLSSRGGGGKAFVAGPLKKLVFPASLGKGMDRNVYCIVYGHALKQMVFNPFLYIYWPFKQERASKILYSKYVC